MRIFSEKPIVYPYAIYETTSENQKITIVGKKSLFKHIKIVETNEVLNTNGDTSLSYTFSSVGEHKVELLLNDGLTSIQRAFYNCEYLKSVSEDLFERGVCLPSDTNMTKEDMERIIKIIKGLFQ